MSTDELTVSGRKNEVQDAEPIRRYTTTPGVDIRETPDRVVLYVDMPGVDETSVEVMVENRELRIEARTHVDPPRDHTLEREEFPPRLYRRAFDLSDRMATEGIKARMAKGVLELMLPIHEEAKPHRVSVEVG